MLAAVMPCWRMLGAMLPWLISEGRLPKGFGLP
jgi:hypothetical protein